VVNQLSVAPAQPEPIDPAEWLEAITYALLALVGIAALATVILWRMLRRIADAVERSAAHRAIKPSP
jgi:protein-S-isoprenylcysteine O-methyltransferase Ste14